MNLILLSIVTGVIGTIVMDLFNYLFSRTGVINKIDMRIIGRMSAGYLKGKFFYKGPEEMKPAELSYLERGW